MENQQTNSVPLTPYKFPKATDFESENQPLEERGDLETFEKVDAFTAGSAVKNKKLIYHHNLVKQPKKKHQRPNVQGIFGGPVLPLQKKHEFKVAEVWSNLPRNNLCLVSNPKT